MPTYKTPGVYVEEISTLPRSVAEVATAIPAFIGYTEKAMYKGKDRTLVPTEITSLIEFESIFGAGPAVAIDSVSLDATNTLSDVTFKTNYLLYDSLRLFFKNGGGKAYIISVGDYTTTISKAQISKGLTALQREDEPTLILFPDAVHLETDLYDLQVEALTQCNKLGDRFAIMDLLESKESDSTFGWEDGVDEFRQKIGVNYLKYGAAYTPYLKSSLPRPVTYRDLKGKIASVRNLADDDVQVTFTNLDNAIQDVDALKATTVSTVKLADFEKAFVEKQNALRTEITKGVSAIGAAQGALNDLFNYVYDAVIGSADDWASTTSGTLTAPSAFVKRDSTGGLVADPNIKANRTVSQETITYTLHAEITALASINKDIDGITGSTEDLFDGKATEADWAAGSLTSPWDTANITANTTIFPHLAPADDAERLDNIKVADKEIASRFYTLLAAINGIVEKARALEASFESNLKEQYPAYTALTVAIGDELMTLPPSAAIAGVYASVDENRGVWKAPANVSLASVDSLTQRIDDEEQEDLNIDATAGKSINAIRPFTGRGILVWGARTLQGNDQEWRYINVRRFYNMAEESIKKSTNWAVFEPNDANLWAKMKAMIENYLTLKWREGALAGAKPEHAFFVNIGLGITMTPQDILDGRLIVEIGMAVVRPAEFIILRFSHKMQES